MLPSLPPLKNERLMASAGTGKTHALTNRYIAILLRQPEPHKIIAMTFTRKAAGEFFQKTLHKLAEAAASDSKAADLSEALQVSAGRQDYLRLMRNMIEHLSQLQLSTYDSFFIYLARCFYLELGLPAAPNVLMAEEESTTRTQILSHALIRDMPEGEPRKRLFLVLQSLRAGKENALWIDTLKDIVQSTSTLFRRFPDLEAWGNPERIWRNQPAWIAAINQSYSESDFNQLRQQFEQEVELTSYSDAHKKGLHGIAENLSQLFSTGKMDGAGVLSKQTLNLADDILHQRPVSLSYRNKPHPLEGSLLTPLSGMLQAAAGRYLSNLCQRTQATGLFLYYYWQSSQKENRRTGLFPFEEITRLLLPTSPSQKNNLDLLYYRMDTRLDHWLLDEFQDTSRNQWQAIHPMVDEAIQDAEHRRSFFYVGDVKQCLYQWRGSDASLFQEIFQYYSPRIVDGEALNVSWRSYPEIIETINLAFGNRTVLAQGVSANVSEKWFQSWQEHRSAKPRSQTGIAYAQLKELPKKDEDNDSPFAVEVAQLLNQIQPLKLGLTVAVILRSNKDVQETADYLRKHTSFPVSVEANQTPFTDNMAGVLLTCWLKRALHPEARDCEHLLRLYYPELQDAPSNETPFQQLRDLWFSKGAEAALTSLIPGVLQTLEKQGHPDPLLYLRTQQCQQAARKFDQKESSDQDLFLDFIEHYLVVDSGSAQSVQITTIHKSKGLDYDIVITLADNKGFLSQKNLDHFIGSPGNANNPGWVLEKASSAMQSLIPAMQQQAGLDLEEQAFGELCALYVAMTRARHGLYMLVENVSANSQPSPNHLLRDTLQRPHPDHANLLYSNGNPEWYTNPAVHKIAVEAKPRIAPRSSQAQIAPRLQQYQPSHRSEDKTLGKWYFSQSITDQRDFGIRVHAFLETIDWLPANPNSWEELLTPLQQGKLSRETFLQLLTHLQQPDWLHFFIEPQTTTRLWKEKTFSLILDGEWINGVFDRVLIEYDASNQIQQVHLLDFKTDRIENDQALAKRVEHHRPQMEIYQRALRELLQTDRVRAALAFIDNGKMVSLPVS